MVCEYFLSLFVVVGLGFFFFKFWILGLRVELESRVRFHIVREYRQKFFLEIFWIQQQDHLYWYFYKCCVDSNSVKSWVCGGHNIRSTFFCGTKEDEEKSLNSDEQQGECDSNERCDRANVVQISVFVAEWMRFRWVMAGRMRFRWTLYNGRANVIQMNIVAGRIWFRWVLWQGEYDSDECCGRVNVNQMSIVAHEPLVEIMLDCTLKTSNKNTTITPSISCQSKTIAKVNPYFL